MNNDDHRKFKHETQQSFRKADHVGRKVGIRILLIVVAIAILGGIGTIAYTRFFGGAINDAQRDAFRQSQTYTESAATFLADAYQEYNQSDDPVEKKGIIEYVSMRYPDLDQNAIDNQQLLSFYIMCLRGG